jgi:hypothetical protein
LDHFIPWSYVSDDAFWNLVPVAPGANASKGQSLPDLGYLKPFIELQHRGLVTAAEVLSAREWERIKTSFATGLHIREEEILEIASLTAAYEGVVPPILKLARSIGFQAGWRWAGGAPGQKGDDFL